MSPKTQRPSQADVISLIIREAAAEDCEVSRRQAAYIDRMMARAVKRIREQTNRKPGERTYVLNDRDMRVAHELLEVIMPDEEVAKPGSAYMALERRHLEGTEYRLVHTFAENRGDHTRFCAVAIAIDSVDN